VLECPRKIFDCGAAGHAERTSAEVLQYNDCCCGSDRRAVDIGTVDIALGAQMSSAFEIRVGRCHAGGARQCVPLQRTLSGGMGKDVLAICGCQFNGTWNRR
jgi:hypothetical protein